MNTAAWIMLRAYLRAFRACKQARKCMHARSCHQMAARPCKETHESTSIQANACRRRLASAAQLPASRMRAHVRRAVCMHARIRTGLCHGHEPAPSRAPRSYLRKPTRADWCTRAYQRKRNRQRKCKRSASARAVRGGCDASCRRVAVSPCRCMSAPARVHTHPRCAHSH